MPVPVRRHGPVVPDVPWYEHAWDATADAAEWAFDNPGATGLIALGTAIVVFDVVTIPSGEGLFGVEMIRRATAQ
jgi:hypothetical protein